MMSDAGEWRVFQGWVFSLIFLTALSVTGLRHLK
jgi:hypothetical protein